MKLIFVMLLICCRAFAQQETYVAPPVHETFDREELIMRATYNDSIMPRYTGGAFYYINPKTGKKLFETGFEAAYPFYGKCAIVKQHGNVGLIGRNGAYIVNPEYEGFEYANNLSSLLFRKYLPELEIELMEVNLSTTKVTKIIQDDIQPGYYGQTYYRGDFINKNHLYRHGTIIATALSRDTMFSSYQIKVMPIKNKLEVRFGNFPDVVLTGDELAYHYTVQQPCTATPAPMLAVGIRNKDKWTYYVLQRNGTFRKVGRNKYAPAFPSLDINADREISVTHNNKFNIVYNDGSMLAHDYDFINGNVGIIGQDVYIIDKGIEYLYYKCKL